MQNAEYNNTEKELRAAVEKATMRLLKRLESEPIVILENNEGGEGTDQSLRDIRLWLFERRVDDGSSNG